MNNLKTLRIESSLNMKQTAKALNLPYTTYVGYEKGDREPPNETLIKIADFYNTTTDYLLNKAGSVRNSQSVFSDNISPSAHIKTVPLVGIIACGTPVFAEENIEAMIGLPENINADFALRCKGDSMIGARISDNDIVFIRKQESVENGEIAAVLIDNEATLKRFYRYSDTVVLRAENPAYKELEFKNEELDNVQILGKAISFYSNVY